MKKVFIKELADELLYEHPELTSLKKSREIINTLFLIIKDKLNEGYSVGIHEFGVFHLKKCDPRKVHIPVLKKTVSIKARRRVKFKASKKMTKYLN